MTARSSKVSIVIPASNEARFLPVCFQSLLTSDSPHLQTEVVIVSNGSHDGTAAVAEGFRSAMNEKGWGLTVLDLPEGNKLAALNAGDRAAEGDIRIYMDADMRFSPRLIRALVRTLDRPTAAFAAGRPVPMRPQSFASRAYTRLWARVPFMTRGVPGCGFYGMNGPGRSRWGDWPRVIADDTFARLHFAPHERHLVQEFYSFPMAEGLSALVRVRRRQDLGVTEIASRYPSLMVNDDKAPVGLFGLAALCLRDPVGFLIYGCVTLAVRAGPADGSWSRAR